MRPREVEEVITTGLLTVSVEDLTGPQTSQARAMMAGTSDTPALPGCPPALDLIPELSGRDQRDLKMLVSQS